MPYCPNCGSEVELDSIYCGSCGTRLTSTTAPKHKPSIREPTRSRELYPPKPTQPPPFLASPEYKPHLRYTEAPCLERCCAYCIDDCITNILSCFCYCPGIWYGTAKDSIREGQSYGKGAFGLRVVDYETGMPATCEQSCIRNCVCGCIDPCCCYLMVLVDEEGRRIGDHMAGTIVILDQ